MAKETKKAVSGKGGGSTVRFCGCDSPYQDAKYGEHQRVHTVGAKNVTCTVCGGVK